MIAGVVDISPPEGWLIRVGQTRPRDRSMASRGGGVMDVKRSAGSGGGDDYRGTITGAKVQVTRTAMKETIDSIS